MESLLLLIPVSLVFLGIAVAIFFWAVNSGQYDDVDREGDRILFDEETPEQTGPEGKTQNEDSQGGEDRD